MPHKLSCVDCYAPIPATHVNLDLLVASCPACDAVFPFADRVGRREDEAEAAALSGREDLAPITMLRPERITEQEGPDGLVLSVSWWTLQAVFLGLFATMWNGMLLFMAANVVGQGDYTILAGMSLHAGVGVAMLYYVAACFLNTTQITVNRVGIDVAHGPLPWPGARTLPVADLHQLFVDKRIIRSKNGSTTVYDLKAASKDGLLLVVAKNLADHADARYLEKRIEGYLGIVDRPVVGEHAG